MALKSTPPSVQQFDSLPDSALVNLAAGSAITGRSRASLYRHIKSGDLSLIKVGHSTKLRVIELRRLIGVAQ